MKKIINKPETLVMEMCNGMVMAHPELELLKKYKVIKKKEMNENKVTLISGGGSGHEPAHAGLVGKGMLDAAVCGDVFASPSQIQVYQAIKETASKKGTLLIIKNYSGDIMNFKNGAHLATEDEMEYGVGIHGEPGIKREKMLSADELANRMTNDLMKDLGVKDGEEIALLVNGFGGTPLQELYLFNNAVTRELAARNIKINRVFVGNYMTSIDMAGMSLTVMKLDDELKTLLSKECNTPAFKVDGPVESVEYVNVLEETEEKEVSFELETAEEHAVIKEDVITLNNMIYLVDKMSDIIIKNEVPFCELDTHAGDGDFGMSVAKGFKQLKREWHSIVEQENVTIGSFLDGCSMIIMEHCGGASGPIWGGAFRAASKAAGEKRELTVKEFAEMLQAALQGIQSIGERSFGRGAVVGDKTLVDALAPCVDSWLASASSEEDMKTAFEKGAEAAVKGAEYTKEIVARMGRAGTVGERSLGYPDAGAHALGVIFTEIAGSLK
ncbi:TPA: dihydroxyacetone kinase subunit DhaL [Bacillus paranthracis]